MNGKAEVHKECNVWIGKKTLAQYPKRVSKEDKYKALLMYLNSVRIRKIALFFGVSTHAALRWIKNAHKILQGLLKDFNPLVSEKTDIIELDEIHTYVKKEK